MIPQRYAGYVFAFIMSGVMSLFISLINIGAVDGIVGIWLRAWALAFTVAFPLVRRLVVICVEAPKSEANPGGVPGSN